MNEFIVQITIGVAVFCASLLFRLFRQRGAAIKPSDKAMLVIGAIGLVLAVPTGLWGWGEWKKSKIPNSLQEAGINFETWNSGDFKLGGKILIKRLEPLAPKILDAVQRGNATLALNLAQAPLADLEQWNNQKYNPAITEFEACHLVLSSLVSLAIAKGNELQEFEQYKLNLQACKRQVDW